MKLPSIGAMHRFICSWEYGTDCLGKGTVMLTNTGTGKNETGSKGPTILVVDDSPFIVDIFLRMLEKGGYRTLAAHSGEESLEILKLEKPDLILLDIMMEPLDGWKTLEKIKGNTITKDIPVLMLTAKQLTPGEAERYGPHIEDYILKPITDTELFSAVEHVLGRRMALQSDAEEARRAGASFGMVNEYARLSTNIDVNRRLMRILETTYIFRDSKINVTSSIARALKNMDANIKFQEARLEQIRQQIRTV